MAHRYLCDPGVAVVGVFDVADKLAGQEPVHKRGLVGKEAPACHRVCKGRCIQCGLEAVQIPAMSMLSIAKAFVIGAHVGQIDNCKHRLFPECGPDILVQRRW